MEDALVVARPYAGAQDYARYLEALIGWLAPLEPALWGAEWPAAVEPATRSGKVAWVTADLVERGLTAPEIAALPRRATLPALGSVAQRFGVAYVLEGAQLGGQLLLRRIGPRLSPLSARWLEGYGADNSRMWRAFIASLGATLNTSSDAEIAAASARETFVWVHDWFSRRGVA